MTDAFTIACQQDSTEIGAYMTTCPMQSKNIDIVPLRYAIDAQNERGGIVNGLLETWRYDGMFSDKFTSKRYTTRQLRDGWLYVYSAHDKQFHEYQVAGSDLIKQDNQSWLQSKGENERGIALSLSSYLTYPNTAQLYLAWSKYRWSWQIVDSVVRSSSIRQKVMRPLNLSHIRTQLEAPHAGFIDAMGPMVADIDNPHADFSNHCVQTQTIEEEHEHLSVKAAITSSSITSALADPQSACFVVLDDPLSDITDLYLHLSAIYEKKMAYLSTDNIERKLQVASIARMYAQVTASEIEGVPSAVLNDPVKTLDFERVLNTYLSEADVEARTSPLHGYRNPKVEEAKQRLDTDFNFIPTQSTLLEYQRKSRYRDEIRWGELNAFYSNHIHTLEKMNDDITTAYHDLMSALMAIGTDVSVLGVDVNDKAHLQSILPLITEMAELVIHTALDEEAQKRLEQALNAKKPQTLLALVPYGLSLELKTELDKLSLETPLLTSAGDVGALSGRMAEMEALFGHEGITNSNWYGSLTLTLQRFIADFVIVVKESLVGTFDRVLGLLFPIMTPTNSLGQSAYQLQGVVLSSLFSEHAVVVNKAYETQWNQYQRRYQEVLERFNRLKALKAGAVVSPDYLRQLRKAEKEVALVIANYPELLTLKNRDLNAKIRAYMYKRVEQSIITGKAIAVNSYNGLKGLGGLVAFLNVWNFSDQWKGNNILSETGQIDKKGTRVILAAGAWTGNAIADVFRGSLWGEVSKNKSLLKETIKEASNNIFVARLGMASLAMGALGVIAAATEGFQTYLDIQGATRESEIGPMKLKFYALIGQLGLFSYLTYNVVGSGLGVVAISSIYTAFISFGLAAFGLLYLFGTLLGNYSKKNPLEEWLIKSIWGIEHQDISAQQELEDYLALMEKPALSLSSPIYNRPEHGVIKLEVPSNYIGGEVYVKLEHIKKEKGGYPFYTDRSETTVISVDDVNKGTWQKGDNRLFYSLQITLSSMEDEIRLYFVNGDKEVYMGNVTVNQKLSLSKKGESDAFLSEEYVYMPLSTSLLEEVL
ncbi:T6SS effector BTH_I2691 family protein [Photobacterium leiognathi]|uniref:T6SS effector BTH_I2691 family protein n=1 Tax=Photobacterium leiognathi TaxID=553611 RepID=UPI002980DCD3|nr:T6SS effector BTH_I2691 family protein [Photobacterium leiognathi]